MSLTLRPATEAEKKIRDVLTHPEWGGGLTVAQYLEREEVLRAHPWSQQGMATWFLVKGDEVLASCETFRTDSTVGADAGFSFAVASVFTEPKLRGRGHAAQLMARLVERLREEPRAQASVLYSDVGAPIYEKSGYRAEAAFDWCVTPRPRAAGADRLGLLELAQLPPRQVGGPEELRLHPSAPQFDWHLARSNFYARVLQRPPLRHFGATTGRATARWAPNYKTDELLVLWLDTPSGYAVAPLLQAAAVEAHEAGLKQVRLWDFSFALASLTHVEGAARMPREGGLPMAVSLGPSFSRWRGIQRALWV